MADWVMFGAACSDIGGLPSANLFWFQDLIQIFGEGYRFQMATWSIEAFLGVQHQKKKPRFTQPHNQSKTFRKN